MSRVASRGGPLKVMVLPVFNDEVLADYFLQAEFVDSLADAVAAEHFHISFIIEFGADISRTFSADVVACNGVHDDFHGSVRGGVYQKVQADVGIAFFFPDFSLCLLVFRHKHDGILEHAWRGSCIRNV